MLENVAETDLINQNTFQRIKNESFIYFDHLMVDEAREMAKALEPLVGDILKNEVPDLYKKYRQIIVVLEFVCLSFHDRDKFLKLIQENLLTALLNGIDINERMTARMYSMPVLSWEEECAQTVNALRQNKQWLGTEKIMIKGEIKPAAPSVENWLTDYVRYFGAEKHSTVEEQQYLSQNPNVKSLSQNEKNILKMILRFYDNLKPIPLTEVEQVMKEADIDFGENEPVGPENDGLLPEKNTTRPETVFAETEEQAPPPGPSFVSRNSEEQTKSYTREAMESSRPDFARQNQGGQAYREPIEEKDLAGPPGAGATAPPATPKSGPLQQGNVINLKEINKN